MVWFTTLQVLRSTSKDCKYRVSWSLTISLEDDYWNLLEWKITWIWFASQISRFKLRYRACLTRRNKKLQPTPYSTELCFNYTRKPAESPDMYSALTVLVETNVRSSLSETLTADVQTVLSDQTRVGSTDSALSRTLTVVSWVGEPNVFVSHIAREVSICKEKKLE